ncbi:MAG: hypothetical protein AW12_02710 [Candidatus Accumulibacter sp. BA-94]|nr:MAG: hypothetical protein AW12_02710 [Candidatus Accumulibacter sp. BA-94]
MKAIEGILDAAANRATGVVDQDVDAAMLVGELFHEIGALLWIGNVHRARDQPQTGSLELGARLVESLRIAGDGDRDRAGLGQLANGGSADSGRSAGNQNDLAFDLAAQRAIDEQIRI